MLDKLDLDDAAIQRLAERQRRPTTESLILWTPEGQQMPHHHDIQGNSQLCKPPTALNYQRKSEY